MNGWTRTVGFAVVGLLVVAFAALTLSPSGERLMVSEVLEGDAPPSSVDGVAYDDLSPPARGAVDEVLREGYTTFSTYDDYAALEALPRRLSVERGGETYHIRTTSADGADGLFEGLARNVLLGVGGLLLGAAATVGLGTRRRSALAVVPVLATVAVLGTNVLAAPHASEVYWLSDASFGIALAVPVLAGIALRRRDLRVGGFAVGTLLLSIGVLLLGDAPSPLPTMVGLVVVGLPGAAFGWWMGQVPSRGPERAAGSGTESASSD